MRTQRQLEGCLLLVGYAMMTACLPSQVQAPLRFGQECPYKVFKSFGYEHMFNVHPPVALQRLAVHITNEGGEWYPENTFDLQLFEVGEQELMTFKIDSSGTFELEGLPRGRYCLRVSTAGWQSEEFRVTVDPTSGDPAPLEVMMYLGV